MKLDIRNIIIGVLGVILVGLLIFHKSAPIDTHQSEINALNKNNALLIHSDDSLKLINKKLDNSIDTIVLKLTHNSIELKNTKNELLVLKNKKNETNNNVSHQSVSGVESLFTNYLNTKGKNHN